MPTNTKRPPPPCGVIAAERTVCHPLHCMCWEALNCHRLLAATKLHPWSNASDVERCAAGTLYDWLADGTLNRSKTSADRAHLCVVVLLEISLAMALAALAVVVTELGMRHAEL